MIPCMYSYTHCPQPCSRLPHASAGDSWILTGNSGSVSCGVTAPLSWVLVHTGLCLCPPRVCFPVLYKFWQLCGGVNGNLLPEGLRHTQVCCTQSPSPAAATADPYLRGRHANTALSQPLWALWVLARTRFV